ncbi:MAG: glycosyltransferase family 39 protein [Bacteroidales bacterium]|nr:glycosyltransferase family 39 protein [Bacteroidales bacterium]
MQIKEQDIKKAMVILLAVSVALRGVLAALLELGNDEVYYWTYALYPDWSHFDHPPMVGWVIQLFSLNLLFDSEFFIRLASVVFMTADTYIIYRIGKDIKDARTGFYAALLYTASIYAFVITGVFIMPDTPLMLFWLLAFWMLIRFFSGLPRYARNDAKRLQTKLAENEAPLGVIARRNDEAIQTTRLLLFGLFAGLAMLSKYSGVFLWVGMGLYILLFNREQLKNPFLYLSLLISAICCLPILYWNLQNGFVSFIFHSERVGGGILNPATFATELAGEFLYNNPVVFVLCIIAVIAALKGRIHIESYQLRLVLCTALPLIFTFLAFSLTRPTLPHWNAPAYVLLILLVACRLSEKHPASGGRFKLPQGIVAALAVMLFVVVVGGIEIQTGFVPLDRHTEPEKLGCDDFTLDMYGWKQLEMKFAALREETIAEGVMKADDGIVADEWFPLANLDYYVARPLGMKVMGVGYLEKLHKYMWINEQRGGFRKGEDFWFLTDSRYYKRPEALYPGGFEAIVPIDTITIERGGKPAKNFFVYACKGLVYMQPTIKELQTQRKTDSTQPEP